MEVCGACSQIAGEMMQCEITNGDLSMHVTIAIRAILFSKGDAPGLGPKRPVKRGWAQILFDRTDAQGRAEMSLQNGNLPFF